MAFFELHVFQKLSFKRGAKKWKIEISKMIVLYILPIGLNSQHFQYFIGKMCWLAKFICATLLPRVVQRKLCHVRCPAQTLPCALFNANFAMYVVQRKLRHVRCSTQTSPCALFNANFAPLSERCEHRPPPSRATGRESWHNVPVGLPPKQIH